MVVEDGVRFPPRTGSAPTGGEDMDGEEDSRGVAMDEDGEPVA
jgi:hypothetical protein